MPKRMTLMGLFNTSGPGHPIDYLGPVTGAMESLRILGLREQDMALMMGVPYTSKMLGRPKILERIPWVTIFGALGGLTIALLLTFATQFHYPIRVGGRPYWGNPTAWIPIFELTMLGLMLGTLFNFLWKCAFPSTQPQYYDSDINHGRIALEATFDMRYEEDVRRAMLENGAERVYEPEKKPL
jgi:hypothetical protein